MYGTLDLPRYSYSPPRGAAAALPQTTPSSLSASMAPPLSPLTPEQVGRFVRDGYLKLEPAAVTDASLLERCVDASTLPASTAQKSGVHP